MYEIKVIGEFCGAHNLRNYKGECEALHGHNWKVEVIVQSKNLDKRGMIMDFKELKAKLKAILSLLDHKHLNNIAYFKKKNPTSENIARFIHQNISKKKKKKKIRVSVWETPNSCAVFFE